MTATKVYHYRIEGDKHADGLYEIDLCGNCVLYREERFSACYSRLSEAEEYNGVCDDCSAQNWEE